MATDIAQDTFMKIWEKQITKPPDEIVGLLYKIAKDQFISNYRKKTKEVEFTSKISEEKDEQSPEERMNYKELQNTYERALSKMQENQREVFLMSRMEDLKYQEIADRLELSVKAVEKRMSLALRFLRTEMAVA